MLNDQSLAIARVAALRRTQSHLTCLMVAAETNDPTLIPGLKASIDMLDELAVDARTQHPSLTLRAFDWCWSGLVHLQGKNHGLRTT